MIRTHGQGRVYHGENTARTAGDLWRDGDLFVVKTTGASYVRTGGAWVQISVGSGTTDHNSLANFDGGTTNEYYHLTATQHTDLTDGGDTTLHAHDAYIANSLLSARGDIIVRNATIPERLALTVPSAPTISFLGVINGETQPSWKSASSAGGADAHIVATDASGYTSVVKLGIGGAPSNYLDIVLPAGNMLEKGISLSRDGGYGLLGNATSASDAFVPMFIGKASVTNGAMYFIGLQPDSSSTAAPLIFEAENGSGAAIDATDELMRINNYATRLITIFGSGGMVIGNPTITSGCKLDIIGGDIRTDGVYRSGTATGTTANVDVAKVGGGTRTLIFVGGLYTGYTDS